MPSTTTWSSSPITSLSENLENPKLDIGWWCQDDIIIRLRPRIEFIFNSAKDHACCPATPAALHAGPRSASG